MYCIVLLALVAAASASSCPEVTTVNNFNFASYGQGTWYEYARYANDAEEGADCGSTEYKLEGDVIKVKSYHVAKNKAAFIEGTARLAPDAGKFGKVIHTLPYGPGGTLSDNLLNIVAIDYDKYLVGYYCRFDEATNSHKDFAWILSRTKILSPESKAAIENIVKESKFMKTDKLIYSKFTEEACKVEA